MKPPKRKSCNSFAAAVLLGISLILVFASFSYNEAFSNERDKSLVWAGLDVFPSLLAADKDIIHKVGPDGKLLLVLVYAGDREAAAEMARHLRRIKQIRDIPLRIELRRNTSFQAATESRPAGIFLTQRMGSALKPIIRFGIEQHVIVFSPFEADVEQGVLGGIVVREGILPYINVKTMHSSDIQVKSFFLRIAKLYE